MIYSALLPSEPLSQGDIVDACPLVAFQVSADSSVAVAKWQERVLVVTQACDVANDKSTKVVVAVIHPARQLVDRGILKAAQVRDQIRRGAMHGWYFLPAAPAPIDLPESIVDLRDLHTIPRQILEAQITSGQRVCRVVTPYREHLAQHFAVTYMRIGLPEPYPTAP
jgi:hypothetical protein